MPGTLELLVIASMVVVIALIPVGLFFLVKAAVKSANNDDK